MAGKVTRNIVRIDAEKCNGCGVCATACAEGAIAIIDGKAKLVSEQYCDGLGACLNCPLGAISIETREAEAFDEAATAEHLARLGKAPAHPAAHAHGGCPSAAVMSFAAAAPAAEAAPQASALRQWPVQLMLVPPTAPFFQGADLLITADCVPYAYADYHQDLLAGRAVVVGCPKLDDAAYYQEKLTTILRESDVRSVTVAIMEVPCCRAMVMAAKHALAASGKDLPLQVVTIGLRGEKLSTVSV